MLSACILCSLLAHLLFVLLRYLLSEVMHTPGGNPASDKSLYIHSLVKRLKCGFFPPSTYMFHGIETGNKEIESEDELLARNFLDSRGV